MKQHHPDVNSEDSTRAVNINLAYEEIMKARHLWWLFGEESFCFAPPWIGHTFVCSNLKPRVHLGGKHCIDSIRVRENAACLFVKKLIHWQATLVR
jgi:hypothetical protein